MKQNQFFITSKLFKELMILDIISKNAKTTQREMADKANVSVAMINGYIEKYSNDGSITLSYHSTKTVEYHITPKGEERRKSRGPISGDVFVVQNFSDKELKETEKAILEVVKSLSWLSLCDEFLVTSQRSLF